MPAPAATIHLRLRRFADLELASLQGALLPADRQGLGSHGAQRTRSLLGRALRRQTLAEALGVPPAALVLSHTPFGKPLLASHPLSFNCTHSRSAYALAWSSELPALGIDSEDESRAPNMRPIAADNFSAAEREAWEQCGHSQLAWLTIWTRKEAALKCLGTGLRLPLASVATGSPLAAQTLVDGPCGQLRLCSWRRQGQVLSLAYPAGAHPATILMDDGGQSQGAASVAM
jgi:phosphopantetheinyl transferase